jgi:hypothetical protein
MKMFAEEGEQTCYHGLNVQGVYCSSTLPVHPLMQICHKFRTYLLKRHKLIYAIGSWINPEIGIIFLDVLPTSVRGYMPIGIAGSLLEWNSVPAFNIQNF